MEDMDWTPNTGLHRGGIGRPSGYIFEMMTWLEAMMESVLVLLPKDTKMKAYRNAFAYIAGELLVSYIAP